MVAIPGVVERCLDSKLYITIPSVLHGDIGRVRELGLWSRSVIRRVVCVPVAGELGEGAYNGEGIVSHSRCGSNTMLFFQQVPYACASPTQVPSDLLYVLLQNGVEDSSHSWTKLLTGLSEME